MSYLQILNSAWDRGLTVAGENSPSCYDRDGYMRIIDMAKPRSDPDRHHFSFFAYRQPSALIQGAVCFPELDYFIKCMHGKYLTCSSLSFRVMGRCIRKLLIDTYML